MKEATRYKEGTHVVYVDAFRARHDALVTRWWGSRPLSGNPEHPEPGCNVVFVTTDDAKTDQYGQQKQHETSVCHKTVQQAPGNYWCWPDE